jgi:hypothetical protein
VTNHNRRRFGSTAWAETYGHKMQQAQREPHRETGVTPPKIPACQAVAYHASSERKGVRRTSDTDFDDARFRYLPCMGKL